MAKLILDNTMYMVKGMLNLIIPFGTAHSNKTINIKNVLYINFIQNNDCIKSYKKKRFDQ